METKHYDSPEPQNKRKGRRYLVIPILALLFQPVLPALLWAGFHSRLRGTAPTVGFLGAAGVSLCPGVFRRGEPGTG
jgi:hypothetical protein